MDYPTESGCERKRKTQEKFKVKEFPENFCKWVRARITKEILVLTLNYQLTKRGPRRARFWCGGVEVTQLPNSISREGLP